jgi:hypothetical protein
MSTDAFNKEMLAIILERTLGADTATCIARAQKIFTKTYLHPLVNPSDYTAYAMLCEFGCAGEPVVKVEPVDFLNTGGLGTRRGGTSDID